jgi:hypothetical protein
VKELRDYLPWLLAASSLVLVASVAVAQDATQQDGSLYAGGTLTGFTQTRSDSQRQRPLGGTTWNGSVFFGGWVSPRVAIEFEPSFGRTFSGQYSYGLSASPLSRVDVVTSRRDMFWAAQVRGRVGGVEPLLGLAYRRSSLQRHAIFVSGRPYFDDSRIENGFAFVLGLDAPVRIAPHVFLLPTFRLLLKTSGSRDPLGRDTRAGDLLFRYGAGARVTF